MTEVKIADGWFEFEQSQAPGYRDRVSFSVDDEGLVVALAHFRGDEVSGQACGTLPHEHVQAFRDWLDASKKES